MVGVADDSLGVGVKVDVALGGELEAYGPGWVRYEDVLGGGDAAEGFEGRDCGCGRGGFETDAEGDVDGEFAGIGGLGPDGVEVRSNGAGVESDLAHYAGLEGLVLAQVSSSLVPRGTYLGDHPDLRFPRLLDAHKNKVLLDPLRPVPVLSKDHLSPVLPQLPSQTRTPIREMAQGNLAPAVQRNDIQQMQPRAVSNTLHLDVDVWS